MQDTQKIRAIETRVKMLELLKTASMTKYQLSEALNIHRETIYSHIRILIRQQCVTAKKSGNKLPDIYSATGRSYTPTFDLPEIIRPKDQYFYIEKINQATIYRFTDKHIPSEKRSSNKNYVSGSILNSVF